MRRHLSLNWVCAVVFLSLMSAAASAAEKELQGLDVYVLGQNAYVADFFDGIYAINIRNPARPSIDGTVDTPGEALGCYPLYDLLVVADGSRGFHLINKRNPGSLRIVASYDTPGKTRSVQGLASTVYVAGSGFGLGVFDVIDRARRNTPGYFLVHPDQ